MDLEEGEVDGDVVVEEPKLGYHASHRFASFRRIQESHYWALIAGPFTSLEEDLLSERGLSSD